VINQNIGKIMICFGGSDRNNLTEICTDYVLKIYKDVEITVIIGKMNTRKKNLKSKYSQNPRINFLYDVSDMWNWYSKSDICIGGGGTMCGERAYIGVPSLIISTAKNQLGNAEYLHNASAALYVGHWENGSLMKNLSANLDSLFSRERRLLLSINGRRLLGKNPTKQVIDKINEIFT
jgi:UDP-2,4-diacetamido-2,4,6-trideoxy-beta-L-altropyranose hydrolase